MPSHNRLRVHENHTLPEALQRGSMLCMSFLTVEVEIDCGHIVAKGPEPLPQKAVGLFTILTTARLEAPSKGLQRPIGLARGQFSVPDDFNAALPEDVLRSFEGL